MIYSQRIDLLLMVIISGAKIDFADFICTFIARIMRKYDIEQRYCNAIMINDARKSLFGDRNS